MKPIWNHMAVRTFLIFFFCLWIPISGTAMYWQHTRLQAERSAYERETAEKTGRFVENLKTELSNITLAGYSVFSSQWYRRLVNSSEVYKDEFNALRQLEISQWIAHKVNSFNCVSDILTVVPSIDTVVCKSNWYTLEDYRYCIGHAAFSASKGENTFITATSLDEDYFSFEIHDVESRLCKGTVCILIDRVAFAEDCRRILNDGMEAVQVNMLDETVFVQGDLDGAYTWREAQTIQFPALNVRVGFPRYEDTSLRQGRTLALLTFSLLTLLSVVVAIGLSLVTIKPLSQLLKRIHATDYSSTHAAFECIDRYLESMVHDNTMLKSENILLNQTMRRFSEVMRDEILFSMVTSPDFDFQNESLRNILPWIDDELYYLMFACLCDYGETAVEEALRGLPCLHREHFHVLGNERCELFWFKDAAQASACLHALNTAMEGPPLQAFPCECSPILRDLQDMRDSYLLIRGELRRQFESSLDLPISVQVELIQRTRKGRFEEVKTLVESVRTAYAPEALLRLTLQIAREYDFDASPASRLYKKFVAENRHEDCWDMLSGLLSDICEAIMRTKRRGMDDLADAVRAIADEEIASCELSRKLIADQLGVDGSLISKAFNAKYGVGFSDYIINKRMEQACALLQDESVSLAAISEKVGYLNYLSFKRAFTRVKGISPRAYRELRT